MFSSILCSSGWISIPQLEHPERSQQGRVDTNTHINKVLKEVYGGTVLPISSSPTAAPGERRQKLTVQCPSPHRSL
jgi:hypothetical protein